MSTKAYGQFFAAGTSVPAGTTKTSPVVGSTVTATTGYGGDLVYRITNGGALGAACTIMFQESADGSNWFDYQPVYSADLSSGTVTQGPSVSMGKGGMYLRAIAYGNTTSACTVEAGIMQMTAL